MRISSRSTAMDTSRQISTAAAVLIIRIPMGGTVWSVINDLLSISGLILHGLLRRLVQLPGTVDQILKTVHGDREIESVHNPLVRDEAAVHLPPPGHRTVPLVLKRLPLPAERPEYRHIAEIVQMMEDGRNPQ